MILFLFFSPPMCNCWKIGKWDILPTECISQNDRKPSLWPQMRHFYPLCATHRGKNQHFFQKLPRIWCLKNVNFVKNEILKNVSCLFTFQISCLFTIFQLSLVNIDQYWGSKFMFSRKLTWHCTITMINSSVLETLIFCPKLKLWEGCKVKNGPIPLWNSKFQT